MDIIVRDTKSEMGACAAEFAANGIRQAIRQNGRCNLILATGASQFEMLEKLIIAEDIDWSKVIIFHLDEYIGLPESHPASFRGYLRKRVVNYLPDLKEFIPVNGDADDLDAELKQLQERISRAPIDVACIGIGENGHIAFNDPPADFDTEDAYLAVNLDEVCRKQQLGEGWFPTLDDVPAKAVTMGIKQILKSKQLVVTVPDERKSEAVKNTLQQQVSPNFPSTILRTHDNCKLFLDKAAACLLSNGNTMKA